MFLFGHKACGILALWPVIKPSLLALEGEVFTSGLPGKSQEVWLSDVLFSGMPISFRVSPVSDKFSRPIREQSSVGIESGIVMWWKDFRA